MKKLIYSVFTLLALSLVIAGCSGDSYEKRLKKEKRAISQFIADNGIDVITQYPEKTHKFGANQFYLEGTTGVYLRVIYAGDTATAFRPSESEEVILRFDSVSYLVSDTTYVGNSSAGYLLMKFTYNITDEYLRNDYNTYPLEYSYMSPACVLPLKMGVGNGAVVDLIVPFLNGSSFQRSNYEPLKFTRMTYSYHKQKPKPSDKE